MDYDSSIYCYTNRRTCSFAPFSSWCIVICTQNWPEVLMRFLVEVAPGKGVVEIRKSLGSFYLLMTHFYGAEMIS